MSRRVATVGVGWHPYPSRLLNAPCADVVGRWAASEGIVSGYGNGKFGTDDLITREQLAVMLYNFEKKQGEDVSAAADLSGYADASAVSDWAQDALRWAVAEGIITGSTSTTLTPAGQATRAEAAAMLQRYLEK